MNNHDVVSTDVLIVGGGSSGLAMAIELANKLEQKGLKKRIMLLEKGASIGSHILSGAVIRPKVFQDLYTKHESCYARWYGIGWIKNGYTAHNGGNLSLCA